MPPGASLRARGFLKAIEMKTDTITALNKQAMCNALRVFINQRSGIEWGNYGGSHEAFMEDYKPILRYGRHARSLLRFVERCDSITAEMLQDASSAYSGRLQFIQRGDKVGVDYTIGQYFPTEYRKAACAVLARCLWDYWASDLDGGYTDRAEQIRRTARREFGRAIASTWFN